MGGPQRVCRIDQGHASGPVAPGEANNMGFVMLKNRFYRSSIVRNAIAMSALALTAGTTASAGVDPIALAVKSGPDIIDNSYADTYDASVGPYGGDNVGPAPKWVTGAAIPSVQDTSAAGATTDERKYDGGNHTLSGVLRCEKFLAVNGATVTIQGHVILRVKEEFKVQNQARIVLAPNASLTIYAHKDFTVQDESVVNPDTQRLADLTIYRHGDLPMFVQNDSHLCGAVVAPEAYLQVENGADFYGRFTGKYVHLKNEAGAHFASTTITPPYD